MLVPHAPYYVPYQFADACSPLVGISDVFACLHLFVAPLKHDVTQRTAAMTLWRGTTRVTARLDGRFPRVFNIATAVATP